MSKLTQVKSEVDAVFKTIENESYKRIYIVGKYNTYRTIVGLFLTRIIAAQLIALYKEQGI